jgi:fatty acid desaturase
MQTTIQLRKQIIMIYGRKSDKKAAFAIIKNWLFFFLFYFGTGFLAASLQFFDFLVFYLPLSFIGGCVLRGFDNLTHEASHNNIFSVAKLNYHLQFLFAYPVCKTVEVYRESHLKHHRNYRKKKEADPDTQQNIRWQVEDMPLKKPIRQLIWLYFIRLLIGYYIIDNIRYNLVPHLRSKKSLTGRLLFWGFALSIVLATHSLSGFFFGYIIPYFFWLPYIRFVTESSKHLNVNLQDEFANSRNNIGLFHQCLLHPHNDGFHQMHHFIPSIPFYNLKKSYRFLKSAANVQDRVIESFSPVQTIKQIFKSKS